MQLRPNKTVIEGQATSVDPAPDGWGANVEFAVERSRPADGFTDFLGAAPGSTVKMFTAEPEAVQPGRSYTVTASVLGGPRGERVVIQDAQAKRR
ncbi:hypothetical protein SAMN02799631_03270 [Methylobacterium sp. 174MFSha1.1]|uniref:hypothetical protein n=1 Tax=Methylobacterium sp. 174MFSha1.1 TaxID=1502749 RepID=UPI0008E84384|nr:hypothetical protein [Methylobacterium sp. 174MFSha1.1]SFU93723.1 hypothetical protein SAMN02799631_03270 [Methylobacterium sp. 174MFSha1.1]